MKTTIRKATDPQFDADTITATMPNGSEFRVYVFVDRNGVPVINIDTDGEAGEFLVLVDDEPTFHATMDYGKV